MSAHGIDKSVLKTVISLINIKHFHRKLSILYIYSTSIHQPDIGSRNGRFVVEVDIVEGSIVFMVVDFSVVSVFSKPIVGKIIVVSVSAGSGAI